MPTLQLWGDGAVSGNGTAQAVAGWGALLLVDNKLVREINGQLAARSYPPYPSNNTGELTAIIEGLKLLDFPVALTIFTDSRYVIDGATLWHKKWQHNNWKTTAGRSVANQKLWKDLLYRAQLHDITWQHVKGHTGVEWNERCDRLAKDGVQGELVDNVYAPLHLALDEVPEYIPLVVDFDDDGTDY